jgi:uncharacterized protein YjiS (DUF1127 family)
MLARHSSGLVNGVAKRYNVLGGEHPLRKKSGISDESSTRAAQPDPADLKSFPAVARRVTDNPQTGFWPSVAGFILEGFALYAASLHSAGLFPVEPHPDEEIPPSSEISARERRGFVSLVSAPVSQGEISGAGREIDHTRREGSKVAAVVDDLGDFDHATPPRTGRSFRWNRLTSRWEMVVTYWLHGRKEREINRAVAALMKLDDQTLRDIGIPNRSQIKQIVRYCHDC